MAGFWDFIKAIRQDDEEEKRRSQEGGAKNRIFGFLDDVIDTGETAAKKVVGATAGLGREIAVKPVASVIGSIEEGLSDQKKTEQEDFLDRLKAVKPEDRVQWIKDNDKTYQALTKDMSEEEKIKYENSTTRYKGLSSGKYNLENILAPNLFGKIWKKDQGTTFDLADDNAIDRIKTQLKQQDESNDKGRESTNYWDRQVFGNEPIQPYQNREAGLEKDWKGAGVLAKPLAAGATLANVAMDLPFSLGLDDAAKQVGRAGLKEIAESSTREAVEKVLKGKIADDALEEIIPVLQKATDPKQVASILKKVDPKKLNPIMQTPGNMVKSASRTVDTARGFADDVMERISKTVSNNTDARPGAEVQKAIEAARNAGDDVEVKRLIDTITDPDLKRGMQATFDQVDNPPTVKRMFNSATGKVEEIPIDGMPSVSSVVPTAKKFTPGLIDDAGNPTVAVQSTKTGEWARVIPKQLESLVDETGNIKKFSAEDPLHVSQLSSLMNPAKNKSLVEVPFETLASKSPALRGAVGMADEGATGFVDAAQTGFGGAGGKLPGKPGKSLGEDADHILGLFKSTSEIDKMKAKPGWKERVSQQFFDKLSPMNKLVGQFEEQTGRKLTTEENPYELMRLYAGMPGQVKQRVGEVSDALEQSGNIDAVRVLGMARRTLGRADDYQGSITPERASRAIEQLRTTLGDEGFKKANDAVDRIVNYNETLLKELGDNGVLSKDAVKEIIDKNPDYFARFQVVNKLLEGAGSDVFHSGQSFNLSRQNVVKAMTGMKEDSALLDPIEAVVKATDLSMRSIAKNNIWKATKALAEEAPDLVVKIREPESVLKKIDLASEVKELRPIRDQTERFIKTRGKWVRRLQSQIDSLEKKGMNVALKEGGNTPLPKLAVEGLGGKVPTSQTVKEGVPNKLGTRDTGAFVRSLIEGPNKEIQRLKKMVGTRDSNMTKILDEITTLKGKYEDVAGKIRGNVDEMKGLADADIPEGYSVVGGFENGVGGRVAIPKEVADVYKGMTPSQMNYLTKIVSNINRVMKESVTSLSLPFAFIRNPIRDFKSMAANSQNIPPGVHSLVKAWTKGFASAIKHDDIYERWIKAGGGGAGIYATEESGEDLAKRIARQINGPEIKNAGDFIKEAARMLGRPIKAASDAIQKGGATLEAAPRLAEFRTAVENGATDAKAALDSRNVTVDFNQSGTVGQVLNQWVPFLNARLQGNKKLLEGAKRNPARFAQVYTTLTAAPIIGTALLNSAHKDVLEQIPQDVKDNNFVIVLGDEQDEKGNFTQVIRLPKGDMDKIFGNPLENFVNFFQGNDSKGFAQVATEILGNVSPVDAVKDGQVNVSRLMGSLLPLAAKVPTENATNHNLYYDSPIVPESLEGLPNNEQVRTDEEGNVTTGAIDRFIGGLTGASPLKVESARQATTGQLLSKDPATALGGSVSGANSNAPTGEFYKVYNKVEKNRNSASAAINDAIARGDTATARQIAQDYNDYLIEAYTPWADRYGKYMTPDLEDKYNALKITLNKRSIKQRRTNTLEKQSN